MKKELILIFENYTLEDVPSEVKKEMKETLNSEAPEFNSFLIRTLSFLTEIIEGLEEGNSIVASSVIDIILAFEFTAKNLVLIMEHEKEDLKILSS